MANSLLELEQLKDLAQKANYRVTEFARLCRVHPRQLRRQFQKHVGVAPEVWLKIQRLCRAEELLLQRKAVKLVAAELGFPDSALLCHQFKARYNMSPLEFVAVRAG